MSAAVFSCTPNFQRPVTIEDLLEDVSLHESYETIGYDSQRADYLAKRGHMMLLTGRQRQHSLQLNENADLACPGSTLSSGTRIPGFENQSTKTKEDMEEQQRGLTSPVGSNGSGDNAHVDAELAPHEADASSSVASRKLRALLSQHRPYALRQMLHAKAVQKGAAVYQDPLTGDLIRTSQALAAAAPVASTSFSGASQRSKEVPTCTCDHTHERHCPHNISVGTDAGRQLKGRAEDLGVKRRTNSLLRRANTEEEWSSVEVVAEMRRKAKTLRKKAERHELYRNLSTQQQHLPCHPRICGCALGCPACPYVTMVEAQRLASVLGIPTSKEELLKLASLKSCAPGSAGAAVMPHREQDTPHSNATTTTSNSTSTSGIVPGSVGSNLLNSSARKHLSEHFRLKEPQRVLPLRGDTAASAAAAPIAQHHTDINVDAPYLSKFVIPDESARSVSGSESDGDDDFSDGSDASSSSSSSDSFFAGNSANSSSSSSVSSHMSNSMSNSATAFTNEGPRSPHPPLAQQSKSQKFKPLRAVPANSLFAGYGDATATTATSRHEGRRQVMVESAAKSSSGIPSMAYTLPAYLTSKEGQAEGKNDLNRAVATVVSSPDEAAIVDRRTSSTYEFKGSVATLPSLQAAPSMVGTGPSSPVSDLGIAAVSPTDASYVMYQSPLNPLLQSYSQPLTARDLDSNLLNEITSLTPYAQPARMHAEAMRRNLDCYRELHTGALYFTSAYLSRFPSCFGEQCRHCPHGHLDACRRIMGEGGLEFDENESSSSSDTSSSMSSGDDEDDGEDGNVLNTNEPDAAMHEDSKLP